MKNIEVFVEQLKQVICDNTYPAFDCVGHPILCWNTDGFDNIDILLKDYIKENINE